MTARSSTWLKQSFQGRDPQDWQDDLIDTFLAAAATQVGQVWYVDPTGAVSGDGMSPEGAFITTAEAITAAVDGRGDMIVRMPGNENPVAVLEFNKEGLILIAQNYGVNPLQGGEAGFAYWPDAAYATGPMAIISAPTAIIGCEFVTRNVAPGYIDAMTTSGAAIAFAGEGGGEIGGFSLIHNCRFVDWWGNPYGIEFGAGAYNVVSNCTFEGFNAGILFRGTSSNNPDHNIIEWCTFVDCVNGIDHYIGGCTAHNFIYQFNVFVDYTDAFDSNNLASDGLITSNRYETATDAATYDRTVAQLQVQGINLSGNQYSE